MTTDQLSALLAQDPAAVLEHDRRLYEQQIVRAADLIAAHAQERPAVLLAGPSGSGKTTTALLIERELDRRGMETHTLSMDDYFCPLTERELELFSRNELDLERPSRVDVPFFQEQLGKLLAGEEVELPRYNFQTGRSEKSGQKRQMLPGDVLVVEGIHALNPELTAQIPNEQIFRVYASALTTILLDNHNYIPTTDNRLLRRIIRDYKYRGVSAQDTIHRWPSVRAGENKWIFPFQENADAMLNTAMLYELAVLKMQAEPLLEQVPENCDEYAEAYRLLKFLKYFKGIPFNNLPPTSLLREFLGGSSFHY